MQEIGCVSNVDLTNDTRNSSTAKFTDVKVSHRLSEKPETLNTIKIRIVKILQSYDVKQ